ncbi:MAG: phosphate signaling complex protein PhoU [Chloroflexota bacterium]
MDKELDQLRNDVLRLASMVDTAIANAMDALYKRDVSLAHSVVAGDAEANQLRYEIEEECLRILATQQPAAIDLRTVIAAIHLAVELERIGDHAAGIAKLVERMENEDALLTLHKLPKMAQRARDMVNAGVQAYVRKDVSIADNMVKQDDKLDKQYDKLFQQTLTEMADDQYVRRATFLLWVGHNLERIGDRATNIAERVIFMVRNQYVEIA